MKLLFVAIGKPHEPYVKQGVEDFTKRISNYYRAEWMILPVPKLAAALAEPELKKKEGELILQQVSKDDFLVALDEKGTQLSSEGLAGFIEKTANRSIKQMLFAIGGAFGLDEAVLKKAGYRWSLSELTFPHQLVRLLLAEQVYRACTILRNEKYHHR